MQDRDLSRQFNDTKLIEWLLWSFSLIDRILVFTVFQFFHDLIDLSYLVFGDLQELSKRSMRLPWLYLNLPIDKARRSFTKSI